MNYSQTIKITDMLSAISTHSLPFELRTENNKPLSGIDYTRVNIGSGIKLVDTNTGEYFDSKGKDTISFPVTISVGVAYRIVIEAIKNMSVTITTPLIETPPIETIIETPLVDSIADIPTDTPSRIILASAYTPKAIETRIDSTLSNDVETISFETTPTPKLNKGKTGRKITLK